MPAWIEPGDFGGEFRTAQYEGARGFAELFEAFHQPGFSQRRSQNNWRSLERGELCTETCVIRPFGFGEFVSAPVFRDGSVQILHGNENLHDAGELRGGGLPAGISSQIARREIVDQKREKRSVAGANLGGLPLQLHAVRALASVLERLVFRWNGCGARGPGAWSGVSFQKLAPDVCSDGCGIGVRLNSDQFQVRAIGETGERHFRSVVGMRAAVFGRDAGRFERVLHGAQIAAGDGYMIDVKIFSYHRRKGKQSRENVFRHVDPILTIPLETERLILDKWQGPDWRELRPIATDVEVMRYITGGVPWTDEQIQAFVNRQVKLYSERNFCRWKVLRKPERKAIGFCGVGFWRDAPDPEIGWWIARKSWGQGLATEAARIALQHAFEHTGFDRIISVAQPPNTASIRIMEKLGLTRDCEFENEGVRLVRYVADRVTWRATNGSPLP